MAQLPSSDTLDRLAYRTAVVAFPIWTFGIITGAIWAEMAWGRYWGWDPKETVAWAAPGRSPTRSTPSTAPYASSRGHAQVGARLYLPKEWTTDPQRCQRAGVGEDVVFQTKPQLGVDILSRPGHRRGPAGLGHRRRGLRSRPRSAGVLRRPRRGLRTRGPVFVPRDADLSPSGPR
ncbi:MAG: cytochrome c biogenesis protein CcsA [Pseudonocardiaceae bacterium]